MGNIDMLKEFPSDVYITSQLAERPARPADHLREKRAIQELAARMADDPDAVLPRFVDLAMELTGGVSAGLSLYEPDPYPSTPGVFRWTCLRGLLAEFDGATTPRDFSPCGVTLDENGPVLSRHPERVYDWIAKADIVVPEVLLVPLHIGGDEPLGTLWIVSDREGHFTADHARALTELATFVGIALRMRTIQRDLQTALEEQEILAREMSHRVKNLFAITDGMIRLSARNTSSKEEMTKVLSGRLHALASANALVRRDLREVGAPTRASDLKSLLRAVLQPHEHSGGASRFRLDGPRAPCGDHAMTGLALVFHELATNAAKYGALSLDGGGVDVTWTKDANALSVRWAERDGPTVDRAATPDGFGSGLVARTVASQFAGELDYSWEPLGLVVTMRLPLDKIAH